MAIQLEMVNEASAYVQERSALKPTVGLILGSGLGDLAEEIEESTVIPYGEIPHFPDATVEGHAGQLVIGRLAGQHVVAMQGRFHYYEGYGLQEVVLPVYMMKALGAQVLIATNAAGGMNPEFAPGDLMLITDHLNLTGVNPLIGPNDDRLGPRFPDMSTAYDPELIALAEQVGAEQGVQLQKGVYAGISGPTYMTAAELKMLRKLGGGAVGMSTVPEVIAARHTGLRVLGISCITDMATGEEQEPLTHEQVVAVADQTKPRFIRLVKEIVAGVRLT